MGGARQSYKDASYVENERGGLGWGSKVQIYGVATTRFRVHWGCGYGWEIVVVVVIVFEVVMTRLVATISPL